MDLRGTAPVSYTHLNGATNVVFPVTIVALAIALLVGDGCAAFLSICQGMRDRCV